MKGTERIKRFNQEVSELKSSGLLVCERVNNYANNRCINCGAKAGHKCEKVKTNSI